MPGFQCTQCNKWHEGIPDLYMEYPEPYLALSEEEKKKAKVSPDLCAIDRHFFVRGLIEIPIIGGLPSERWGITVWVSLAEKNFVRYLELYNAKDVTGEGPYFAWLCNEVDGYSETYGLKTTLHLRPHPKRPLVELQPTTHPLALHQRNGITMEELMKIIGPALHGAG